MTQLVTVRGFVATEPELKNYESGVQVTGFRLASTERRLDRATGTWEDGPTNWFSVSCFRDLGVNVVASVHKSDPVVVTGRLRIRQFQRDDHSTGTSVGIEAESVGHDLALGTSTFARRSRGPALPTQQQNEGQQQNDGQRDDAEDAPEEERPAGVDADGVLQEPEGEGQELARSA